jgi:hypothetical protein
MIIKDSLGAEIDLTGHTFRGQVRKTVSNAEIQAAFSFVIADQITDTGKVTCTISATDTALIDTVPSPNAERKITKMAYDIESEDVSGIVNRWLQGIAEINPEATR